MFILTHNSRTAARVTPGRAPLASGVVQTTSVSHPKNVATGSFGNEAARIEQDGFVRAGGVGFGRAMTSGSLLAVLKFVSGSLAGRQ